MTTTRRTRLLASTLLLVAVAAIALAQARPKPRDGDQPAPADPAPVREVVKVINAPGTYQMIYSPPGNGFVRLDTRTGEVDQLVEDARSGKCVWVPLLR